MDYISQFKQYLDLERRSAKTTINNHCYYAVKFLTFLSKSPSETAVKDIQDYMAIFRSRNLSNGTISNFITSMRVFFNWYAYKNKSADLSELSYFLNKILRTKQDKSIPKVPTPEEIERLRSTMTAYKHALSFSKKAISYAIILRDMALIEVLISTGARSAEVRSMRVEDINLEKNEVIINGKGGNPRVALFSAQANELLKEYIQNSNLSYMHKIFDFTNCNILNAIIRRWARKAGINPQIHCHSMRHYHITYAREKGVPDQHIKDQVGNYTSLDRYTHLSLNSRRDKYKVCDIG